MKVKIVLAIAYMGTFSKKIPYLNNVSYKSLTETKHVTINAIQPM